ncbi:hypothetical protein BDV93DRAFT_353345 [Ceratobasidium sp. AG-I]|nr:hypothetical protein BDV93DRAFT_353345 [Ceratobasidium sp. AG-I]
MSSSRGLTNSSVLVAYKASLFSTRGNQTAIGTGGGFSVAQSRRTAITDLTCHVNRLSKRAQNRPGSQKRHILAWTTRDRRIPHTRRKCSSIGLHLTLQLDYCDGFNTVRDVSFLLARLPSFPSHISRGSISA